MRKKRIESRVCVIGRNLLLLPFERITHTVPSLLMLSSCSFPRPCAKRVGLVQYSMKYHEQIQQECMYMQQHSPIYICSILKLFKNTLQFN